MTKTYLIRRKSDNRPISGIFTPIDTPEQAQKTLERWQYNWPNEEFFIEIKEYE